MDKKIIIYNPLSSTPGDKRKFPLLGISYLVSAVRAKGYICDLYEHNLIDANIREKVLKLLSYDIVAMSITTPAFDVAMQIASLLKCYSKIPIIIGGHHATFEHKKIIEEYKCIDAIICGEGEEILPALCEYYFNNGKFDYDNKYVTYRNQDYINIASDVAHIDDINNLIYPARDNFAECIKNSNGVVTISSSRGCPYSCSYCSATHFRNKWIGRTPENIADEVFKLCKYGCDFDISFVDDNFYIIPERAIDILKSINKRCNKKFKYSFATRVDQIIANGLDNLVLMKKYGCVEIELGVENGSEDVLQRYNKNITPNESINAISMIKQAGIKPTVDFIMFDPYTSKEELKENNDFLKKSGLWGYDFPLIYERVIAFPGTKFTYMHPELYNTKCYVEPEIYFENFFTTAVYEILLDFRNNYQNLVCKKIDWLRVNDSSIDSKELMFYKILPYYIFEKLVYTNDGEEWDCYRNIIEELLKNKVLNVEVKNSNNIFYDCK